MAALPNKAEILLTGPITGPRATIYLFGGVALAYHLEPRVHKDADVSVAHAAKDTVKLVALAIGFEKGWGREWLDADNDVFVRVGKPDRHPTELAVSHHTVVQVASLEFLLAMKLYGCRAGTDEMWLPLLCQRLGLQSMDEALALFNSYYPGRMVNPLANAIVTGLLGGHHNSGRRLI